MEEEIWKISTSYPAYSASSWGRIMVNPHVGRMPNGGERTYGGYAWRGSWSEADKRFVTVRKGKTFRVARIVCDAFHGPPPEGAVCMHLDEDSRNNRPENLAWGTQKENLNAAGFSSTARFRARRLTNDEVRAIRQSQERPCDLARAFGVKPCTISNIRSGRMRKNA